MTQALANPRYDTFYAQRNRSSNNGVAMMPVAGPYPTPAAVVGLNGGLELDIITYVATCLGQVPYIPAPVSKNPNRIFLSGQQSAVFPVGSVGGVNSYAVAGQMVFGILTPEGLKSDFMIGKLPFEGVDDDERIPANYLLYGLINDRVTQIVPGGETEYFADLPIVLQRVLTVNR